MRRTAAIGIGLTLVSIAATFAGGCDKPSPADLVLTLDGQPYRSNFQNGGLNSTADPTVVDIAMCVHPSVSGLAAVDDDYCQVFQVASDLFQTLAIPATLRVLGTASTVDSQPGVPTDGNPVWTFAPETGHAPQVVAAFMEHRQNSATWDGVQTQHLDGTLVIGGAAASEYRGQVDVDVIGALPPVDLSVERHAHLSGSFTARTP